MNNNFSLKLYFYSNSIKFLAKVFSKCNMFWLPVSSWKTNHKGKYVMSCIPFDIQRLKLDVAKSHYAKAGITYNYLVFSTNLKNISCENYLLEGKTNLGHKCKHKHFIQWLSTNCMGKWFLIINKPIFSRNIFCCIWSFWKGYLVAKNWQLHYYMYLILFFL